MFFTTQRTALTLSAMVVCALGHTPTSAIGGVTLEYRLMEDGDSDSEQTPMEPVGTRLVLQWDGAFSRMDMGSVSTILDATARRAMALLHERKIAVELHPDRFPAPGKGWLVAEQWVATGGREMLDGQDCRAYTATHGDVVVEVWIAADHPCAGEFASQLARLDAVFHSHESMGTILLRPAGVPMRLVVGASGKGRRTPTRWQLVSARCDPLSPEMFERPAGYRWRPALTSAWPLLKSMP